jgi:hypothetical protein
MVMKEIFTSGLVKKIFTSLNDAQDEHENTLLAQEG